MNINRRTFWAGFKALVLMSGLVLPMAVHAGEASDWDITDTGQPYTEAEFTVTEGTWMSVDVSPDGKTLAFDLLGDIYTLPVRGGTATLVHGGPAMQRTPKFSADGKQILYISDLSGADNLWLSDVDGSHTHQVTHEKTDIITGPAWGPNAQTVAAAKTYATFPDMHASEIRLFDLAGGAGQVVVETPPNGRDVEEASFSRDGRYLYYTQRVTDPNVYVDANHINYVIKRRNLKTGDTEQLIGGFGGATTPQVSPDGKRVAFVRRVGARTVLFVYNVETGEQTPVYDKLDRDVQADFTPHGSYYPQYDWFPDSRHVAIWGKGKLYNIDMQTAEVREIPFKVTSRQKITKPPRFGHDLAPDHFKVRVVRQLAPSPDGKTMIFEALGHIWRKSLPDGKPQRLTKATAFEFEPVYSADGRQVAYATWDDEKGGTVKVMSPDGRHVRTLASSSGAIREPAFSPDGSMVAYRVQEGDKALGGYRAKPGLYLVSTKGGEPRYLTGARGVKTFSPDGQRIYYTTVEYSNRNKIEHLKSVNLDGLDMRDHARTPDADTRELNISPDLHWIAFREYQQYYVMPYRETGSALTVTARSNAMPIAKLTDLSSYALTWSRDSATLNWALGPKLYRTPVKAAFAENAKPVKSYTSIGLVVKGDVPEGTLAFTNGRIIMMKGDQVIEHGTIVIRGNKIVAVGPNNQIDVPKDAKVIDVTGKTLLPGFIDMHGHIDCCYGTGAIAQKQPMRYAALAFGVTTNFDPYSTDLTNYESTETGLAGLTVSPRWIGSGRVIYGRAKKPDYYYVPINSYEDARRTIESKVALGGTFIKSYKQPTRRQRQMLVKASREFGILDDVEGEGHFYHNITMILDGHSNLEHSLPVANYYDDIIQLFAHSDTSDTPTLVVSFGEMFGESYMYQHTRAWEDPKVKLYVQETTSSYSPLPTPYSAPPYVRGMTTIHAADEIWDIGFRSLARSVKKLDDAGVRINVGSHGDLPGLGFHWEMQLLSQGGMSNFRILHAATINGATTLGVQDQIGSLEVGKLADMVVLDKNPLEDLSNTNSVRYTMVNGRLYDSLSMNEIGNYDHPRSKFYWELPDYHGIDWNDSWAGH